MVSIAISRRRSCFSGAVRDWPLCSMTSMSSNRRPQNNKMQRTKPGPDGASPLILVLCGP